MRPESFTSTRNGPGSNGVSRCSSSKASATRPRRGPTGRPSVTQGLCGENRNAGCEATSVQIARGLEPDARIIAAAGSRSATSPMGAGHSQRRDARGQRAGPAAARTAGMTPSQRGPPIQVATSPARLRFAQAMGPTTRSSTAGGNVCPRPAADPGAAREANSGARTKRSPNQSPSRPPAIKAAGTAKSRAGFAQAETNLIWGGGGPAKGNRGGGPRRPLPDPEPGLDLARGTDDERGQLPLQAVERPAKRGRAAFHGTDDPPGKVVDRRGHRHDAGLALFLIDRVASGGGASGAVQGPARPGLA